MSRRLAILGLSALILCGAATPAFAAQRAVLAELFGGTN
jgi:hypothetical protein